MSNTEVTLCLFALLSIYAFAAALDEQDEQSVLRRAARARVAACTYAASRHGNPVLATASAPTAAQRVC